MKEINDIYLKRMNNGAHFLFVSNVLARAEAFETVAAKTAAYLKAFKTAVEKEDEVLKLSQKSMLSDDIAKADSERDSLYGSYKSTVKAFLKLPTAELAEAAKLLNQHLTDYAIDPRMQLDRETGLLVNFITDLEGKYKSEVELLSLNALVSHLKTANDKVREYLLVRNSENSTKVLGALKAARAVTDEAYRALVKMVNSLAVVEGDTEYAAFIDEINTMIVRYRREVLGQSASASTSTGTTTTTEDDAPVVDDGGSTDEGGGTVSEDDVPEVM